MHYQFPFGEELHVLSQQDRTPKKVFVLGVYASAVHARWLKNGRTVCQALAVASEPRIFWDGDPREAEEIIRRIRIPQELGTLVPADRNFNGPSAKVLDDHILAPLGCTREEAWLCDCLPEARLNPGQVRAIRDRYDPLIREYGLNEVTVPPRPSAFCDGKGGGDHGGADAVTGAASGAFGRHPHSAVSKACFRRAVPHTAGIYGSVGIRESLRSLHRREAHPGPAPGPSETDRGTGFPQ